MQEFEATSKEAFAAKIRGLAYENNLNLIDTITSYCEDNDIQMEDVIPLLDKNMVEELKCTAIQNRYVRGFKKVKTLF